MNEKTRNPKEIAADFQKLIDKFDSVTCAATDCQGRLNGMYSDLRPIGKDVRLAGTALTVKTIAGAPVNPGDIILIDGNGACVVPYAHAEEILAATTKMMETETNVSDKLRAGTTIGKLINIDKIMNSTFAYQERALEE